MSTSCSLVLHDNSSSTDATEYRRVLGALQYLSLTRSDISYAVNKLSQFIHCPSHLHWVTTKRLPRYLKHTIQHGLFLKCNSPICLHAFFDADWAGNRDDKTSTTAFVIYVGSNPSPSTLKSKEVLPVLLLNLSIE